MKIKKRFVIFFLCIALPAMGLIWIGSSATGLRYALDTVIKFTRISLQYNNLQGTLFSRISADEITYSDDNVQINIAKPQTGLELLWLLDARLVIDHTQAEAVILTIKQNQSSTIAKKLKQFALPIPISVKSAVIQKLTINREQPLLEIVDINAVEVLLHDNIQFKQARADIAQNKINAEGKLGFLPDDKLDIHVQWSSFTPNNIPPYEGTAKLSGTLNNLQVSAITNKPENIHIKAALHDLTGRFRWDATIHADRFHLINAGLSSDTSIEDTQLNLEGDMENINAKVNSLVTSTFGGRWHTAFDAKLSKTQWQLIDVQLRSPETDTIVLLQAASSGDAPYSADPQATVHAKWQNLQWPLTGAAEYKSAQGEGVINGLLSKYDMSVKGDFNFSGFMFNTISIRGSGSKHSMRLSEVNANYLDGALSGNVELNWAKGFQWKTTARIKSAHPEQQWPDFIGVLDVAASARGDHQTEQWSIHGDIADVGGLLQGYPLQAKSTFKIDANHYAFNNIALTSKNNQLFADIAVHDYLSNKPTRLNAKWKLRAGNLNHLVNEMHGKVNSEGTITGELSNPHIVATVHSDHFAHKENTLGKIALQMNADLSKDTKMHVSGDAQDIKIGGYELKSIELNSSGTTNNHTIKFKILDTDQQTLNAQARGAYQNKQWQGKLTALKTDIKHIGHWTLKESAELVISDTALTLNKFCATKDHSSICMDIQSEQYTNYTVNASINELPLSVATPWLPEKISDLEGNIDGAVKLHMDSKKIHTLNARLVNRTGKFTHTLVESTPRRIEFRDMHIAANKVQKGLTFSMNLDLVNTGNASANFSFLNVNNFNDINAEQPVSGLFVININNLSLLPIVIPEIQSIQGFKHSEFVLSGTLNNPIVQGTSNATASKLALPQIGIELKDIVVNATSTQTKSLNISGSAASNGGTLTLQGAIPDYSAPQLRGDFHIGGNQFLAAKLPDIEVKVSPDVKLALNGNKINMSGEVFVNSAHISLLENAGALTPSGDVVIVDKAKTETTRENFVIEGALLIKLSEDILVQSSGFMGRIRGEIKLVESPGSITLGTGELLIMDGRFTAYGQELVINKGKLIYAATPVDNPLLDIRAQRPNTGETVVGVHVTGHARSPKLTLYSEPAMDETDILSYLVLGYPIAGASKDDGAYLARIAASIGLAGGEKIAKSLAKEFGIDEVYLQSESTTQQASLVLGKYLSPKLYVRYAVGIGQAADALKLQYKLTDKWTFQTEATEGAQGADIIYTIEKD